MKNTWSKTIDLSNQSENNRKKKSIYDVANLIVESIFVSIIITMRNFSICFILAFLKAGSLCPKR